jgi:hypothetical protein
VCDLAVVGISAIKLLTDAVTLLLAASRCVVAWCRADRAVPQPRMVPQVPLKVLAKEVDSGNDAATFFNKFLTHAMDASNIVQVDGGGKDDDDDGQGELQDCPELQDYSAALSLLSNLRSG